LIVKKAADDIETFSDPFQAMVGFQLRRTSVAVMSTLAGELDPLGLNPSQASLIMLIGANPGCTQSAISRALRAKPANLVPLINQLSAAGALERVSGRGRAIALSLTEQGRDLHGKAKAVFERHEARIGRGLSAEKRAEMIALLRGICTDACCPGRDGEGAA
jgi:DNA-binding MarR family transcriptional regulator